jgi:hypothetical protein
MSSSPSPAPDLAIRPPLATRAIGGAGTSILIGGAIGVAAWVSDQLPYPFGLLLPANAIGAWLGVAFALGASARTIPTGALRGVIGLLSAVAAYYALNAIFGQGYRVSGASHAATIWGAVALVTGPVMGLAGGTWRHATGWPRALAVSVLAAALIAEGVMFGAGRLARVDELGTDPGALLLGLEIVLGAVLPLVLLPRSERLRGYLATAGLAVAGALAIGPVSTLIRAVADRF